MVKNEVKTRQSTFALDLRFFLRDNIVYRCLKCLMEMRHSKAREDEHCAAKEIENEEERPPWCCDRLNDIRNHRGNYDHVKKSQGKVLNFHEVAQKTAQGQYHVITQEASSDDAVVNNGVRSLSLTGWPRAYIASQATEGQGHRSKGHHAHVQAVVHRKVERVQCAVEHSDEEAVRQRKPCLQITLHRWAALTSQQRPVLAVAFDSRRSDSLNGAQTKAETGWCIACLIVCSCFKLLVHRSHGFFCVFANAVVELLDEERQFCDRKIGNNETVSEGAEGTKHGGE
mmetsp:Transcript_85269/g.170664  ORF Transcript_85269/g.170664 Transcript_85269/m.170664 type:complete len:285 (-) Transcript_85269:5770-6624(-)